jgi:hypothetical protein
MWANAMIDKFRLHLSDHIGVESRAMYLYRLDAANRQSSPQVESNAEWALLKREEIPLLTAVSTPDLKQAAARFNRGDKCYVARVDGKLAHHSWVQTSGVHPITEAGISRTVAPGEFWIYHCHTADWARGHRLYPIALGRILCEHFQSGFKTAWIYTQDFNTVSQRGIERSQFQRASILRALRVGPYYLPVRS